MDWGRRPSPAPARERPWGARASKPFLSLQTARAARGPETPPQALCPACVAGPAARAAHPAAAWALEA